MVNQIVQNGNVLASASDNVNAFVDAIALFPACFWKWRRDPASGHYHHRKINNRAHDYVHRNH